MLGAPYHELLFELELHRAECEFLTGELADRGRAASRCFEHAPQIRSKWRPPHACALIFTTDARSDRSRQSTSASTISRRLGIECVAASNGGTKYDGNTSGYGTRLGSREIEELIDLPSMTDPASSSPLWMFSDQGIDSCRFSQTRIFMPWSSAGSINLSLEHGNNDGSCFAYVLLGTVAGRMLRRLPLRFQFGQLGCELVEKRGLKRSRPRRLSWSSQSAPCHG